MISVYACAEAADGAPGKEAWFRALPDELGRFPEIKAMTYFHDRALRGQEADDRLCGREADGAHRHAPTTPAAGPETRMPTVSGSM